MRLLAISGSLRAVSLNTRLLQALKICAPAGIDVQLYEELGALPLFNPDLEGHEPDVVRRLFRAVDGADALVIASPEYAHGVTGSIKNLLDWLVGGHEFVNKPVAVLNAAPRAHHALDALKETIRTMNGNLVEPASLLVPVASRPLPPDDIAADAEYAPLLDEVFQQLRRVRSPGPSIDGSS